MRVLQTQEQANDYWANHEYKKWVVKFTKGPRARRVVKEVFVGSTTRDGARRSGVTAMVEMGHGWARSATSEVRLATAQDLGCVHIPEKVTP